MGSTERAERPPPPASPPPAALAQNLGRQTDGPTRRAPSRVHCPSPDSSWAPSPRPSQPAQQSARPVGGFPSAHGAARPPARPASGLLLASESSRPGGAPRCPTAAGPAASLPAGAWLLARQCVGDPPLLHSLPVVGVPAGPTHTAGALRPSARTSGCGSYSGGSRGREGALQQREPALDAKPLQTENATHTDHDRCGRAESTCPPQSQGSFKSTKAPK